MRKNRVIALSLSLMMALSLSLAYTGSIYATDKKSELNSIKEKQKAAEAEKGEIVNEIEQYNTKIVSLNTEITNAQSEIDKKQAEIDELNGKIDEMQAKIDDRKSGMSKRLRTMYKNGSVGFIDIILDSRNFSELLSNLSMLQKIYKSDRSTLNSLEKISKELNHTKKELSAAQQAMASSQSELKDKKGELDKVSAQLEAKAAKIDENLAIFNQQAESLSSQIAAELAAQQQQAAVNNGGGSAGGSSGGGASYVGTGGMISPVSNYVVTSEFGNRVGLEQYGTFHGAIDLACPMNTPVVASDSGRVMNLTGWYQQGYGWGVFIDHGNGIVTAYGHNSALVVSPGQYVQKGQIIAYSGMTGWATGPHVHFEVRVNGTLVNPRNYVAF
ncbi:MAG: peptidoglycan DD-metalloendopeptidase family protein [[Eubacterium] sulci]|nr:peptidoglycan DD-metalloendopeptidase family protein [[Eubacterium] sulci]MBF1177036.1 peptidoglycan DD-metalloendopeptidase family protein [[Eubacterium] sulci]MBF1192557.1 peptidoglycan DD-metalloendopeptidase family protein [[Eubacterium] sulci]